MLVIRNNLIHKVNKLEGGGGLQTRIFVTIIMFGWLKLKPVTALGIRLSPKNKKTFIY